MKNYRKATPKDDIEIASVSVEGWKYAYKGIMPNSLLNALDPIKRAVGRSSFLKENTLSTYVCTEFGKVIGFVDFEKSRDDDCNEAVGEVWAIYVLPQYIGKQFGKGLFSLAAQKLVERGYREITVWVLSQNKLARDFYERQGLTADGCEKMHSNLTEIRYRKVLTEGNMKSFEDI
ncbi:MAG: GNAT family N-acetyltransferase [Leucothrix sp.]